MSIEGEDDLITFVDDIDDLYNGVNVLSPEDMKAFIAEERANKETPWNILIVDDEESVHDVSDIVLQPVVILGKSLKLHHCYSGADAVNYLKIHFNIDLMLLDCVMESQDAGFRCAEIIKQRMHRDIPIIILRTGFAGLDLEHKLDKLSYISDFIYKTDATRQNLINVIEKNLKPLIPHGLCEHGCNCDTA